MSKIRILDTHTANRIAAGEVVERPASIVKELLENAIDAGATTISVEAQGGGIELIRVRDNGSGIPAEDVKTAFARHATSKISRAEDLEDIATLGFRGEALPSIAAVSRISMRTCIRGAEMGALIRIEGGDVKECLPTGCPAGMVIEVANLFYNTPARLKFLKSTRTETALISDCVSRMMLGYPAISFKLIQNGRTIYHSAGDGELQNVIFAVYGHDVLPHLKPIAYDDGYIRLCGYAGSEQLARANRNAQSFFINHRYIKSQRLSFTVQRAYDTRLMQGRFPFIVMDIGISGREIDVNVHPNKLEVRFRQEDRVMRAVHAALREALGGSEIPEVLRRDVVTEEIWRPIGHSAELSAVAFSETPSAQREGSVLPEAGAAVSQALSAQHPTSAVKVQDHPLPRFEVPPRDDTPHAASASQLAFPEAAYRIIGQVFGCYWLLEQGESVYFIDQHAAHERKLYETLMQKGLTPDAQMLLVPLVLQLSPTEYALLMENLPHFTELGFDIEEFGPLTVSIRAVPYVVGEPQTLPFFRDALEALSRGNKPNAAELKRDMLIQAACKHAIKAGMRPDPQDIEALLSAFLHDGVPMTCPHGRPVMARMQKRDFEKLFRRLV